MRILALDQSSQVTGWAIFQDGKLDKFGKFDHKNSNVIARISSLKADVLQLIEDESIDKVILEEIQMQGNVNNVTTFKVLAFVLGTLEILMYELDMPYETLPSSTWKSICGVKGRARAEQKKDAQRFVMEEYQTKAIQDIVDAICIGHAVTHRSAF